MRSGTIYLLNRILKLKGKSIIRTGKSFWPLFLVPFSFQFRKLFCKFRQQFIWINLNFTVFIRDNLTYISRNFVHKNNEYFLEILNLGLMQIQNQSKISCQLSVDVLRGGKSSKTLGPDRPECLACNSIFTVNIALSSQSVWYLSIRK